MAYSSVHGRKPMERASKISHANIIASPEVQALLDECKVPEPADPATLRDLLVRMPDAVDQHISVVVAVDGSYREAEVQSDYPSSTITFFAFGPLLFKLEALRELDQQSFIAPEDLARLKKIQRYVFALPTRNISRNGLSLKDSVRTTLRDFFAERNSGDEPLQSTLRWLIFQSWDKGDDQEWMLERCPNERCSREDIVLKADTPDAFDCDVCNRPIYLIDVLRLNERIDEEQGAGGIISYVLSILETLVLVHVIRAIWNMKPALLREVLFIKDGPLAVFGQVSPLSKPLRALATFLGRQPDPSRPDKTWPLLNVVGLEKSGAFVEHAMHIDKSLTEALGEAQAEGDHGGVVLALTNEYIYKYIVPGNPDSSDPYGGNTYWGGKLIFKADDGSVYVASAPTFDGFNPAPKFSDFMSIEQILNAVGELRCSMYDNALIPVALANRLVSLSDVPSARILEAFARESVRS